MESIFVIYYDKNSIPQAEEFKVVNPQFLSGVFETAAIRALQLSKDKNCFQVRVVWTP